MTLPVNGTNPRATADYSLRPSVVAISRVLSHPRFPAGPEPAENVGVSGQVDQTVRLLVHGQTAAGQRGTHVVRTITHQQLLVVLEMRLSAVTKSQLLATTHTWKYSVLRPTPQLLCFVVSVRVLLCVMCSPFCGSSTWNKLDWLIDLTAIFKWNCVSRYQNVSILDNITGAKDDGSGGDNWSYRTCKAPVKSSPPTSQHPTSFTGRMAFLSPNHECQSTRILSLQPLNSVTFHRSLPPHTACCTQQTAFH